MALGNSIRIEGLKQLSRVVSESDEELDKWLRDGLLEVGDHAARRIRSRYQQKSAVGAAGVKAKVMKRGNVIVAQTLRRSRDMSRRRSAFGSYEMRHAFLPGLDDAEEEMGRAAEELFHKLEEIWQ